MRKLVIIFQILILCAQSVQAADTHDVPAQTATVKQEKITPQMPKNYRLPDMHLLDSVAFYNKYKDEVGKRVTVEGYLGRFGSTFGEDFKKKLFEIESQSHEKVEIILSLTSTLEDAKIFQKRMALENRKMVIVEIPDSIQVEILKEAEARAAKGLKELWWDTKHKTSKLLHPIKTLSDTKNIISNQFVAPNKYDMNILKISIAANTATTALMMFMPGVDPTLALTMGIAHILIGGPTLLFRRTITNLYRADITKDVSVVPTLRQILLRMSTLAFGMGEAYYGIGSSLHSDSYNLTQSQIFSNTVTSGVIDNASAIERDRRLSIKSNYKMYVYSLLISSVISTIGMTGMVGPMTIDYGFLQISTLQTFSLVIFSGLWLSYKYYSNRVEKVAQRDLKLFLIERYRKLVSFRRIQREEADAKAQELMAARARMSDSLKDIKANRIYRNIGNQPICSSLFR